MSSQSKKSEEIVRQYAEGLRTLDLSKIAFILAPEFKFTYRLAYILSGHGLTTDVRYIGHMYRTFYEMKNEGVTEIKTGFCELEHEGAKFLSIKLFPPHDRRILFPMDEQVFSRGMAPSPEGEAILFGKAKEGFLHKIECYNGFDQFLGYRRGKVLSESV
jgi:hypothetical protein